VSAVTAFIINADDLGYDPGVTRGILEAMGRGVVGSCTFMVNTPHSEAAARACPGDAAVGLHLNLARWKPLGSVAPEKLDAGGAFVEAKVASLTADEVHREARAQLARLEALLGRPATHVDVHKHLHRHPQVLAGLIRAALETGLPVRSMDAGTRVALRKAGVRTNDVMLGDAGAEAYWTLPTLEAELAKLPEVHVVELMCHPGYRPEVERSGYAAQREVELATFTSEKARALLQGLPLTDWRALAR